MKRSVLIACLSLLALCGWVGSPVQANAADATTAAANFVETLGKEAMGTLAEKQLSPQDMKERFRKLLIKGFDVPYIGRFVLAMYWRQATPPEQAEFLKLFERMIVETYSARFAEYKGEGFRVVSADARNAVGDIVVTTEIFFPGGPPNKVEWVVRKTPEGNKIIDVIVQGISMGVTQRQEFASVIQRNGGTVSGLIKVLREKLAAS